MKYDEFKTMLDAFSGVYGKRLTGEAFKVWYRALRSLPHDTVASALAHASMNEPRFPTPARVQDIAREIQRAADREKYRPRPLASIKADTEYGRCCMDIILAISRDELSKAQGVQSVFHAAGEMGIDLQRGCSREEAERLEALRAKYEHSAARQEATG